MVGKKFRFTGCDNKKKRSLLFLLACLAGLAAFLTAFSQNVCGAENEKAVTVEFFYENVCAACEGDADFYAILDETIPKEERRNLNIEVRTYNVFLDSCKAYYDTVKEQTAIPDGTDLPVLVVGNCWVNGYDGMEDFLREQLLETPGAADGQDTTSQEGIDKKNAGNPADDTLVSAQDTAENTEQMANEIIRQIKESENRMFLLFTTNACDDCEQAEDWIKERYWRIPFLREHERMLDSSVADICNLGPSECGTITAGLFIRSFAENVPWIHLDIAGTAWVKEPIYTYQEQYATGTGVETIYRWLSDRA